MAVTINASTSAGLVQTADTSGVLQLQTNSGTTAVTIDTSQNVGIGTTNSGGWSGNQKFAVQSAISNGWSISAYSTTGQGCYLSRVDTTAINHMVFFYGNSASVGSISPNGTNNVTYSTSSDYRLKENITPMIGALEKVMQLNPVTYTWKNDGSIGQGFIAHELQEIVSDCVVGKKDAVNEDGSIKPQQIDTSFLVATLTAAIQELAKASSEQQALITSLTARITALEAK